MNGTRQGVRRRRWPPRSRVTGLARLLQDEMFGGGAPSCRPGPSRTPSASGTSPWQTSAPPPAEAAAPRRRSGGCTAGFVGVGHRQVLPGAHPITGSHATRKKRPETPAWRPCPRSADSCIREHRTSAGTRPLRARWGGSLRHQLRDQPSNGYRSPCTCHHPIGSDSWDDRRGEKGF